jgi:hypothetical protein
LIINICLRIKSVRRRRRRRREGEEGEGRRVGAHG